MKIFNHAFTIAFSLENSSPSGEVTAEELITALQKKIEEFKKNPESLLESTGCPFDTYECEK